MPRLRVPAVLLALLGTLAAARAADPPPYRTFAGNTFEPSAAAYDPDSRRLLVLNDKDAIVYRYELKKDGALELPAGEIHRELRLPHGRTALKFEALTRLPDGQFLAATAFDRPEDPVYNRVVRFRFRKQGPVRGRLVRVDTRALARAVRGVSQVPWFKVEGLAVDATAGHVFFGVRQVGQSHNRGVRDVVLIVRCPFDGERVGAPEAVFSFTTRGVLRPEQGLSDLQRDPRDGSYLILTSHEAEGEPRPGGHGGALFRVPGAALEDPAPEGGPRPLGAPLRTFRAKSEGLALLPGGGLLVVFDDDRDWKKLFRGYEQSEGLFERIDPAP